MTDGLDLFPSERGTLVSETALNHRFNRYCEDLGLSPGLDIHSLRRSYITHLIDSGLDLSLNSVSRRRPFRYLKDAVSRAGRCGYPRRPGVALVVS
jgi:site-specific recombinase XerD